MFGFKEDIAETIVKKAVRISRESIKKLVFPDTDDEVIRACSIIKKRGIANPILLGDSSRLSSAFRRLGISNLNEENLIDYLLDANNNRLADFSKEYILLRKADGKFVTDKDADEKMKEPHYYGAMLVHKGLADGMISGFQSATKPYYPAFEIIKTARGVSKTSGVFFMINRERSKVYFFADCAMVISPASETLAEIGYVTAKTCERFGFQPKVAMLSFSTRDSAKHEMVEKVKLATAIIKKKHPEIVADGEIQLDAAIVPEVARKKCPDSVLNGEANVLVFPDLNSGNISYKLMERLGGFEALGPILQGLRKPINDLSRGCSTEDMVKVAAITVIQGSAEYEYESTALGAEKRASPGPKTPSQSQMTLDDQEEAINRLPSNIRKIIDEHRSKKKKEDFKE